MTSVCKNVKAILENKRKKECGRKITKKKRWKTTEKRRVVRLERKTTEFKKVK